MIAYPCILAAAAEQAGMSIPEDPDMFEQMKEEHPHFHVFCILQLGKRMHSPDEHWNNAKVIANIPKEKLVTMTLDEFINEGVSI